MGRPLTYDSERVEFCALGIDHPECGTMLAYRRDKCSDVECRAARRRYTEERRVAPFREKKAFERDCGTIECFREGCRCKYCVRAEDAHFHICEAEDLVFANEDGRISSHKLRHGHGEGRAGYARGCRCELCRLANTLKQAQRRGSATVPRRTNELWDLKAARQAQVDSWLESVGWTTYDAYFDIAVEAAEAKAQP